ncbi:MAG: AAA family ATPase [Lachnospiraceae bacterium]|nr:AAA family ATPase [Lachnospiraceae bacterium]
MGNYLNIGNDGFAMMCNDIYVDKTELIAFINSTLDTPQKLTCVSRPRRFGKSFAVKMLGAYYDKKCDSRALFEGLDISLDSSFEKHLNKYDVISIDMTYMIYDAREQKNVIKNLENKVIQEVRMAYPEVTKSEGLIGTLSSIAETTGNV